jgi:NitT/TauT family transport system substrate-binding protein
MRRVWNWRWVGRLVLAGALLLGLAAGTSPALAGNSTVRVGIANVSSDAPFFIASKKGFFAEEGLDVQFIAFDSGAKMIAPLAVGQLDVGGGSSSAGLYNAAARGAKIKIVADKGSIPPGYGYSAILVRKDLVDSGKVKSFADFKGLKVAIGEEGTGTTSALNEALKRGGLRYSDVDIVMMGYPQHLLALANKAVDVTMTNEPTVTRAVREGVAVRLVTNDQIYPNQQVAVVVYGDSILKRPDVAHKFMRAYIKAVRAYNDALKDGRLAGRTAEDVISILTEFTAIKDPEVYRTITPQGCNPDGRVNDASLKKDFAFFRERGLIVGKIQVDEVLDASFAERAVRELGPYQRDGE